MKQTARNERNPADYGYPSPDVEALSVKAIEVTLRLTEKYGVEPFSSKDPMSMLVDIILSHRTRDEQTAAAYDNLNPDATVLASRPAPLPVPDRDTIGHRSRP